MPFVLHALLGKYGYRTTLRAMAVALTLLTGPLIPLLKSRLPPSQRTTARKIDWKFLRSPLFWMYSTSNLLQGFGYFFPSLYLPTYASSLSLGGRSGALLLALMSVSQVCGQFVFGFLSDRKVSVNVLACLSTTIAAISCLTMWRLAKSLPIISSPKSTEVPSSISYRWIIVFTGVCMFSSACTICLRYLKQLISPVAF